MFSKKRKAGEGKRIKIVAKTARVLLKRAVFAALEESTRERSRMTTFPVAGFLLRRNESLIRNEEGIVRSHF